MLLDAELMGDELAVLIREHVADALRPVLEIVAALEAKLASAPAPRDGKDADPEFIRAEVAKSIAEIPKAVDGQDADPELIRAEVAKAVDAIPKPKDGQNGIDGKSGRDGIDGKNGVDGVGKDGRDGIAGKDGRDGTSVTVADITPIVRELVSLIPAAKDGRDGKDGTSVALSNIEPMIRSFVDALPRPKDGIDGQPGRDGKDANHDPTVIEELKTQFISLQRSLIETNDAVITRGLEIFSLRQKVDSWPEPKDGKDADPVVIAAMVKEAVEAIPKPRDGVDADPELVRAEVAKAVALIPKPKDGTSVELADVMPELVEVMEHRFAQIPLPRDGTSVTVADVQPLLADMVSKAVGAIPIPQDGKSVDPQAVALMIRSEVDRAVAEMPTPSNGEDGADGKDGAGLDDIEVALKDDDRTVVFKFRSGDHEVTRELRLAIPIDAGVHQPGRTYEKGDCVTWGGSLWIAQKATSETPGSGSPDYRLAVKRGRDANAA